MNLETAKKINNAACNVYHHMNGIKEASNEDFIITQKCSISQIETASEHIEAHKQKGVINIYISSDAIKQVKSFTQEIFNDL